jgi:transcriptional regulator with XRE-family HTH domain
VPERPRESADQRLGHNLRIFRERKGISQRELAEAMSARGHAWHQQTVTRIEAGSQAAKFSEAADLSEIVGVPLDRLTLASGEARISEYLYASGYSVLQAHEAVAEGVRRLLGAVEAVAEDAARNEGHPSERVQEARKDALGRVDEYGDVGEAIAEGIRRHEERPKGPSGD